MLGSDKQVAKWIPLASQYRVIGSYAQTELGHGKAAKKTQHFRRMRDLPRFSGEFEFTLSMLHWGRGGWGKMPPVR